jgi:hypothetical protein
LDLTGSEDVAGADGHCTPDSESALSQADSEPDERAEGHAGGSGRAEERGTGRRKESSC